MLNLFICTRKDYSNIAWYAGIFESKYKSLFPFDSIPFCNYKEKNLFIDEYYVDVIYYVWILIHVLENLGRGIVNETYASIGLWNNRERLHPGAKTIGSTRSGRLRCTCNKRYRVYEYRSQGTLVVGILLFGGPRARPIGSLSML